VSREDADVDVVVVIQGYENGLDGVRAVNPELRLRIDRADDQRVLTVEYPPPTGEPAARDVQCAAVSRDWSGGSGIAFRIKPDHDTRLSVSFFDRNHVVYTAWRDLKGGDWQLVRIAFAEIQPNPFFQPPDARTGSAIDVSDVPFLAFAPQDKTSGQLTISRFVVTK
jgi:Carbohydrate binding domain (family 11)